MTLSEKYEVAPIKLQTAKKWFLYKHYAKRIPSCSYIFGLIEKETRNMKGVVSFGMPPSPTIAPSIAGKEFSGKVLELNRLVLHDNKKNEASFFIAAAIKLLPPPHCNYKLRGHGTRALWYYLSVVEFYLRRNNS